MPDIFNASAPLGAESSGGPDDRLASALDAQATALLDSCLELVEGIEQGLRDSPIDPDELQALEEITGADDAPLEFKSLRGRVERGLMTWEEFWQDPYPYGQVGINLVFAVVAWQPADLPDFSDLAAPQVPGPVTHGQGRAR